MRWQLPILFALAGTVHLWQVANTATTARDGVGFARTALRLGVTEDLRRTLRGTHQPPGYPAAILAMDRIVAPLWPAPRPEQLLLAAQLVSALAGTLIVWPFHRIALRVLSPWRAFAAGATCQLIPTVARCTSDALGESLFLLSTLSAMALAMEGKRTGSAFLAGLLGGVAYLVRPEGLLVAAGIALGGALDSKRKYAAFLAALLVPVLAYSLSIGGLTNKPSGTGLIAGHRAEAILFADFGGQASVRWAWCAKTVATEYFRATHYAIGTLAVIGVIGLIRTIILGNVWRTLLIAGGLHLAAVVALAGMNAGYLSDRHFLPLVPIAVLLAFRALTGRGWWIVAMAIAASCVFPLAKPLHGNREGHKHVGRYLATVLTDGDSLVDPFEWAGWYAGRTLREENPAVNHPAAIYAVLDDATEPGAHGRLRRMDEAVQIARDPRSELVFRWPADGAAKVRVYRFAVSAGRSAGSATAPRE